MKIGFIYCVMELYGGGNLYGLGVVYDGDSKHGVIWRHCEWWEEQHSMGGGAIWSEE